MSQIMKINDTTSIKKQTLTLNPNALEFHSVKAEKRRLESELQEKDLPPLNLYTKVHPDPVIHGEGPFAGALPAKARAPASEGNRLEQIPMWHADAAKVGDLYNKDSIFVKHRKDGSISLIYEQQLRHRGIHGYTYTVHKGHISAADGIGFVFADRVPCSKNVKRLWSIFANRKGRIVKRVGGQLVRSDRPLLPPLSIGNILSMVIDLNLYRAVFEVRLANSESIVARASVDLSDLAEKVDCSRGYLCAAVTQAGVVVHLGQAQADLLQKPSIPRAEGATLQQHSQAYSNTLFGNSSCSSTLNFSNGADQYSDDNLWNMPDTFETGNTLAWLGSTTPFHQVENDTLLLQPEDYHAYSDLLESIHRPLERWKSPSYPLRQFDIADGNYSGSGITKPQLLLPQQQLTRNDNTSVSQRRQVSDSLTLSQSGNGRSDVKLPIGSDDGQGFDVNQLPHNGHSDWKEDELSAAASLLFRSGSIDKASELAWRMLATRSDNVDPSRQLFEDPAVLSAGNRGLSTASNSSAYVGMPNPLSGHETTALLQQMQLWQQKKKPLLDIMSAKYTNEVKGEPNRTLAYSTVAKNCSLIESAKDTDLADSSVGANIVNELPYLTPLPLAGNRTVSAPPGSLFHKA